MQSCSPGCHGPLGYQQSLLVIGMVFDKFHESCQNYARYLMVKEYQQGLMVVGTSISMNKLRV